MLHFRKARLCARGFEELQDFRTDSPTCSREGIRSLLAIVAANSWTLNSLDVRTAFLQGKDLERSILVKPPKECNTDKLWKLNKCVYGLADASRYWYLKLAEELHRLGAKSCKLDQGLFLWFKGDSLLGTAGCFVDDILWAGCPEFNDIMIDFRKQFKIRSEHSEAFTYIGMNLTQLPDKSIRIDQESYINSINLIELSADDAKEPCKLLNEQQRSYLRGSIGQLNWIAGMSRPEINFSVSEISSRINIATISDIKKVNKIVKFVKNNPTHILFPNLNQDKLHLKAFSDASYNNLHDGGSQGGHIVFLCDDKGNSAPIIWNSSRIKRVVRSTLAAETLECSDACDSASFMSLMLGEFLRPHQRNIKIEVYTDSKSLHDAAHTTNLVTERMLRVDMSAIRELINAEKVTLHRVSSSNELADVLTKRKVHPHEHWSKY